MGVDPKVDMIPVHWWSVETDECTEQFAVNENNVHVLLIKMGIF